MLATADKNELSTNPQYTRKNFMCIRLAEVRKRPIIGKAVLASGSGNEE